MIETDQRRQVLPARLAQPERESRVWKGLLQYVPRHVVADVGYAEREKPRIGEELGLVVADSHDHVAAGIGGRRRSRPVLLAAVGGTASRPTAVRGGVMLRSLRNLVGVARRAAAGRTAEREHTQECKSSTPPHGDELAVAVWHAGGDSDTVQSGAIPQAASASARMS